MGYLVGDFQNAFIPGRHISDNILLANEAIHKINSHKKGRNVSYQVLSCNMVRCQNRGDFKGVSLCSGEENLTHLLFVDDAVFFLQDQNNAASSLREVLDRYCRASGQVINEEKSGILFSPSTKLANARRCLKSLRIKGNKGLGKYLGLPTDLQESKRELFKGLIDQVMKRISSWNGIFLSPAGRFTLISSVLSNLSTYFLSVFKIPAMLAKHAWKIVSSHNSLLYRVFRKILVRTCNRSHILGRRNGNNLAWGARSILYGLEFVQHHIAWKPGLNSNLNVWTTKWVNGESPEQRNELLSLESVEFRNTEIRDLQNSFGTGEDLSWNEDLGRQLFAEESADRILAMPICGSQMTDKVFWLHNNKCEYSVKSGYGIIQNSYMERNGSNKDKTKLDNDDRSFCKSRLWQLPGPPMWKILVWRIITDTLSVGSNFAKRNFDLDHNCKLYNHDERVVETMEHLFRDCDVARRILACSDLGIRYDLRPTIGLAKWVINWIRYLDKMVGVEFRLVRFLATLWCLWSTRNRVLFRGEVFHPMMFLNSWTQVVKTVDRAMGKVKKAREKDDRTDHESSDESLTWTRDSSPIHMIGNLNACERIRVMVDGGWKSIDMAGIGWVALTGSGNRFYTNSKAIKAESALQTEAIGIKN
ncbi:uncharacterized protein LOC141607877 [Silene latifolia]|uniref:uncharacterized protein LOC141607877 n=1 Tax=Silene latifolia TaxID=37657 RepID=UPI003D7840BF